MEQCAVGGEYGDEPLALCCGDKLGQVWMKEGFAHQVEVEKLDAPRESVGKRVKLLGCELMPLSGGLGTKHAIEVAAVGYF